MDPLIDPAYFRDVGSYPLLSEERQNVLIEEVITTGDEGAAETLVNHNLRLVLDAASRFRLSHAAFYMDIIQAGNLGLHNAVGSFDPSKGVKFSTFAYKAINNAIYDFLSEGTRTVRIKTDFQRQQRFLRTKRALVEEGKSVLDEKERVAEEVGVSAEFVAVMDMFVGKNEASLDAPLKKGDTSADATKFIDMLPIFVQDGDSVPLSRDPIFKKRLMDFFKDRAPRDREIFMRRYFSSDPPSLQELALEYAITRKGIHRIEKRLIEALKRYMGRFAHRRQGALRRSGGRR